MVDPRPEIDPKLLEAILQRLEEDRDQSQSSQWEILKKVISLKDVIAAIVFLGSILWGSFAIFEELRSKPSEEQVSKSIEDRVSPLETLSEQTAKDLALNQAKTARLESISAYLIESSAWQGDVLYHLANKSPGKAPAKPVELIRRERELLSQ